MQVCALFLNRLPIRMSSSAAAVVVVEKVCGRSLGGVKETGMEWRAVGHCEVLDGMGEWVGGAAGGWMGRLGGGDSRL